MPETTKVYLLTIGTGEEGNEWDCQLIFSTLEKAEKAKELINSHCRGTEIERIEEWELDPETYYRAPGLSLKGEEDA